MSAASLSYHDCPSCLEVTLHRHSICIYCGHAIVPDLKVLDQVYFNGRQRRRKRQRASSAGPPLAVCLGRGV